MAATAASQRSINKSGDSVGREEKFGKLKSNVSTKSVTSTQNSKSYSAQETPGKSGYSTAFSHTEPEIGEKGAINMNGPQLPLVAQKKCPIKVSAKQVPPQATEFKTGRRLYIMRHAERMDRIFPGWLRLAFTDMGKYRPYDLNQPLTLPKRAGGAQQYHNDTPITEMGYVTSQMIGRGMRLNKVYFTNIVCSPALRCVQTAHGMLKTLNMNVKICIEPGLFEWLAWYESPPVWMTPEELQDHGFFVDTTYEPIMPVEELLQNKAETIVEHYERCHTVIQGLLDRFTTAGPILVLGHGTSLDACSRNLLRKDTNEPSKSDMDRMGMHFPYCSVVAIEELVNNAWKVVHNPVPPITYLDFSNRINFQFFNR